MKDSVLKHVSLDVNNFVPIIALGYVLRIVDQVVLTLVRMVVKDVIQLVNQAV